MQNWYESDSYVGKWGDLKWKAVFLWQHVSVTPDFYRPTVAISDVSNSEI